MRVLSKKSCICNAVAYNSSIFISRNGSKKASILAPLKNPPFTGDFLMVSTRQTYAPLGAGARQKNSKVIVFFNTDSAFVSL